MFYIIKAYLKFLKASTNQHGVHSPFVYSMVTQCFYDKTTYKSYKTLKQIRKNLYNNSNTINITDFGSGSRVFKSNKRVISKIAKTSGITSKRAKLLFRLTRYMNAKRILELGTSVGLGTSSLSLGNQEAQITTIEGCPEIAKVAQQQFKTFKLTNIDSKIGLFSNIITNLGPNQYDLIYVDGNHTKEATLRYFEMLHPKIHNDSVIIFDDIHWSKEMTEAWEIIKNHSSVSVSINTFFWGLVFFRKEQVKEHFTIRI